MRSDLGLKEKSRGRGNVKLIENYCLLFFHSIFLTPHLPRQDEYFWFFIGNSCLKHLPDFLKRIFSDKAKNVCCFGESFIKLAFIFSHYGLLSY